MKIENRLTYLKHPDSDDPAEFFIENNYLLDKHSNRKYPVISGMMDFVGINIDDGDAIHDLKSIFFRLNTWFSRHIDGRILMSIFASGGVGFMRGTRCCVWRPRVGSRHEGKASQCSARRVRDGD